MRRPFLTAALATIGLLLTTGCPTNPTPSATLIHDLTAYPNPVAPGGSLTLSWSASNVGSADGSSPYCTLQRTRFGLEPDPLTEVDCVGSLVTIAPTTATTMTYQFSALRRDGSGYVTRSIVIHVSNDDVVVTIAPPSATLPTNGTQPFTATVTGAANTSVAWSATCGTISGSGTTGTYTAPGATGTCTITATSAADPTRSATATVVVTDDAVPPLGSLHDDFDDRDYTANPAWALRIAGNKDLDPLLNYVDASDRYARLVSTDHDGRGGTVGLEIAVDIPVGADTMLVFDALATFRDVGNGCGWTCREYPANVSLHLQDAMGNEFVLTYAVNYGDALEDQSGADWRIITTPVTQGLWERNLSFVVRDGWAPATRTTMVRIFGSGWNFDGGIDNIALPAFTPAHE
jgi:hypothetical protein